MLSRTDSVPEDVLGYSPFVWVLRSSPLVLLPPPPPLPLLPPVVPLSLLQVPRVKYTFWNHDCSLVALASKHTVVIASKQLDQL